MRKYKLKDGGVITASDPTEFVHQLKLSSWFDNFGTDEEYMVRFAKRYKELYGDTIRTDTASNFQEDLVSKKYALLLKS